MANSSGCTGRVPWTPALSALPPTTLPSVTSSVVRRETLFHHPHPQLLGTLLELLPLELRTAGEGDLVADPQRFAERPVRRQRLQAGGQPGQAGGLGGVQNGVQLLRRDVEQLGGGVSSAFSARVTRP